MKVGGRNREICISMTSTSSKTQISNYKDIQYMQINYITTGWKNLETSLHVKKKITLVYIKQKQKYNLIRLNTESNIYKAGLDI